jgi:hypothetical protein
LIAFSDSSEKAILAVSFVGEGINQMTSRPIVKPEWRRKARDAFKRRFGPSDAPNIFEDLGQCRVRITDPESGAYVTLDFGGFHGAKIIEERGAQ